MWATLIGFEIYLQKLRDPSCAARSYVPTATFQLGAEQAERIWHEVVIANSTEVFGVKFDVEFEIVVKKTAEAIGD